MPNAIMGTLDFEQELQAFNHNCPEESNTVPETDKKGMRTVTVTFGQQLSITILLGIGASLYLKPCVRLPQARPSLFPVTAKETNAWMSKIETLKVDIPVALSGLRDKNVFSSYFTSVVLGKDTYASPVYHERAHDKLKFDFRKWPYEVTNEFIQYLYDNLSLDMKGRKRRPTYLDRAEGGTELCLGPKRQLSSVKFDGTLVLDLHDMQEDITGTKWKEICAAIPPHVRTSLRKLIVRLPMSRSFIGHTRGTEAFLALHDEFTSLEKFQVYCYYVIRNLNYLWLGSRGAVDPDPVEENWILITRYKKFTDGTWHRSDEEQCPVHEYVSSQKKARGYLYRTIGSYQDYYPWGPWGRDHDREANIAYHWDQYRIALLPEQTHYSNPSCVDFIHKDRFIARNL
jgi:hypothetical protein